MICSRPKTDGSVARDESDADLCLFCIEYLHTSTDNEALKPITGRVDRFDMRNARQPLSILDDRTSPLASNGSVKRHHPVRALHAIHFASMLPRPL